MSKKQFDLIFKVTTAMVTQAIVITDDAYNESKVIEGLNNGTLITTMWHSQGAQCACPQSSELNVEVEATGKKVAYVESQAVDGVFTDFRS